MTGVIALALIGAMCSIGVLLRRWVPLFRNYLVPATVIAGVFGVIVMNAGLGKAFDGVDATLFGNITTELFTLTFISIGLTAAPTSPDPDQGSGTTGRRGRRRFVPQSPLLRGAWAMGLTWVVLFAVQELIGVGVVASLGSVFGMPAEYGLMAAFGFAQGPGQAATFGAIFADQGWDQAVSVGLTFASLGFLAAFLIGVPLAKRGISRDATHHTVGITGFTKRGLHGPGDDAESMGRETTFSGSIESLGFALSIVGVCYLGATGISALFGLIPGFVGETMSGMMFMNGLCAAYLLRWLLGRAGAAHIIDPGLQRRITGLFSDFTVVTAFMAVQLSVVVDWIVPILVVTVVVSAVTLLISVYLGKHYGSDHDFERTLGVFGTGTGTAPTGLALVRIVDPSLRTPTGAEMGLMNLPEQVVFPVVIIVSAVFAGALSTPLAVVLIAVCLLGYLLLAYWAGDFDRASYRLTGTPKDTGTPEAVADDVPETGDDAASTVGRPAADATPTGGN
jgi:ESS family glutamate:Na+ symporter